MRATWLILAIPLAAELGRPAPAATINVTAGSASALRSAMSAAKPGDTLVLSGTYNMGTSGLTTSVNGTATARITVKAAAGGATLAGGASGNGLGITNDYYTFQGLTISGFQKSVRIDNADHGILDGLVTSGSSGESIKLKDSAQYWLVENCTVNSAHNEGFYAGDADQNWTNGVPDASGYITFYNDHSYNTGNDGFDCKEGTHDIKIINCSADWGGSVPGIEDKGNSGVYDRANRMQVINFTASHNGSTGDVVRANRMTAVDGITYGSGTEIYNAAGADLRGWFLYTNHLDTVLYGNYSLTTVDGGLLEPGSAVPAVGSVSGIAEETWNGEGGARFYSAVVPEAGGTWAVLLMRGLVRPQTQTGRNRR